MTAQRLKNYEGIFNNRSMPSFQSVLGQTNDINVETDFKDCDQKRRLIIVNLVRLHSQLKLELSRIQDIVCSGDISWMINKANYLDSDITAGTWSHLVNEAINQHNLRWKNTNLIGEILEACNQNTAMRSEFEADITPVELDSEKAKQLQASYLHYQNLIPKREIQALNPPPHIRVIQALEEVESGKPELWGIIFREMTLSPTSQTYNPHDIFKADITALPGWSQATEQVKARVIKAAQEYIHIAQPEDRDWINGNSFSHATFTAYKALHLLAEKEPDFIAEISIDLWKRWMLVILRAVDLLDRKKEDICHNSQAIIEWAYKSASNDFMDSLLKLMIGKDYKPQASYDKDIYRTVKQLLDHSLAEEILNRVSIEDLNAGILEILLTDLCEDKNTLEKAQRLINNILNTMSLDSDEGKEKLIVASRFVILSADNINWSSFWELVEQDNSFGKKVIESTAIQAIDSSIPEKYLKEDYLADLCIFRKISITVGGVMIRGCQKCQTLV